MNIENIHVGAKVGQTANRTHAAIRKLGKVDNAHINPHGQRRAKRGHLKEKYALADRKVSEYCTKETFNRIGF